MISNLEKTYRNSIRNPEHASPRFSRCFPCIPSFVPSLCLSSLLYLPSCENSLNTCSFTSKYLGVFSLKHLLLNYDNHSKVIKTRTFSTDILLLSNSQKKSNVKCLNNAIYRCLSSSALDRQESGIVPQQHG